MKPPPAAENSIRPWLNRTGRLVFSLLLDISIVLASYGLGLYLKFDGEVPNESWNQLVWAGPLIAFAYILAYQTFGVYRTAWQYGSIRDALLLAAAVGVATAGILTVNVLLPKRPIPLTVNVISAAFIFLFHGVARLLPRLWSGSGLISYSNAAEQRVLIVGAGDPGQLLAWELQHNRTQPFKPAYFIDDDEGLKGKRIHGIAVFGRYADIPAALRQLRIDMVAVALPPEQAPSLQQILTYCEPFKVPVRLVPTLSDVLEGRAQRGQLREVTMEDLLARAPVDVDEAACRRIIEGRIVMIIGAAGSIGSELTRMVAALQPAALHLIDTHETGLHELRIELLQRGASNFIVKPWLCNIADRQKLQDVFEACQPQVVFHLAAYKHITMVEENPDQAFENNVLGTLNVFEAAQSVQADEVVFISSHTAVNPVSVYGASKRIGELLVTSMPGKTRFCAVRLTNVIDAKGAVLGIFARQIDRGGPISVTDPEVARFFLTINEVAGLVIQAASICEGGDIFLLDVGEEILISDLAERLIKARGLEPGKDIEIIITGLRPGEKLREKLIADHERLMPSSHPKVLTAVSSLHFSGAELRAGIRELEVDRRRRTGNLPARLHALARFDRSDEFIAEPAAEEPKPVEAPKD